MVENKVKVEVYRHDKFLGFFQADTDEFIRKQIDEKFGIGKWTNYRVGNETKMKIQFTHYWVSGFGWENTVFIPYDFVKVEVLGSNEKDGTIFLAYAESGAKHIIKGKIEIYSNP